MKIDFFFKYCASTTNGMFSLIYLVASQCFKHLVRMLSAIISHVILGLLIIAFSLHGHIGRLGREELSEMCEGMSRKEAFYSTRQGGRKAYLIGIGMANRKRYLFTSTVK